MNVCCFATTNLPFIWGRATPEAKGIIVLLAISSIFVWGTLFAKAMQMRRAKKLNLFFEKEFRSQEKALAIFDRRLEVEGCPLFTVYKEGCLALDARLKITGEGGTSGRDKYVSIKSMEHIKRTLENTVSREALKMESGLILLAVAVSGAPFLGLLGTVWGVMDTFASVAIAGKAELTTMAPGVSAALVTTVAGLLVAIPSMVGYNFLVHNVRTRTVELDNFAQDLVSKMETEYLRE